MLKLFAKKDKAVEKWHSRAMLIDHRKTKLTIVCEEKLDGHLPPWVYKKPICGLLV